MMLLSSLMVRLSLLSLGQTYVKVLFRSPGCVWFSCNIGAMLILAPKSLGGSKIILKYAGKDAT